MGSSPGGLQQNYVQQSYMQQGCTPENPPGRQSSFVERNPSDAIYYGERIGQVSTKHHKRAF
jgi:hypothetical protein